jgi:hypothetical protein
VRIAVIAIQPQRITDYGKRLMAIVFLFREDAAENRMDTKGWKDPYGEPASPPVPASAG